MSADTCDSAASHPAAATTDVRPGMALDIARLETWLLGRVLRAG